MEEEYISNIACERGITVSRLIQTPDINQYFNEILDLRTKCQQMEHLQKVNSQFMENLSTIEIQLNETNSLIETKDKETKSLKEKMDKLQKENFELKQKQKKLQEEVEKRQKAIGKLQQENYKKVNQKLIQQISQIEDQNQQLKTILPLRQELENLKIKYQSLTNLKQTYETKFREAHLKAMELEKQQSVSQENLNYEQLYKNKCVEIEQIKSEIQTYKEQIIPSLQSDVHQNQENKQQQSQEINKFKQDLIKSYQVLDQEQRKYLNLKSSYDQLISSQKTAILLPEEMPKNQYKIKSQKRPPWGSASTKRLPLTTNNSGINSSRTDLSSVSKKQGKVIYKIIMQPQNQTEERFIQQFPQSYAVSPEPTMGFPSDLDKCNPQSSFGSKQSEQKIVPSQYLPSFLRNKKSIGNLTVTENKPTKQKQTKEKKQIHTILKLDIQKKFSQSQDLKESNQQNKTSNTSEMDTTQDKLANTQEGAKNEYFSQESSSIQDEFV